MTSLIFGAISHGHIPPDEAVVRMPTAPVSLDTPPAMADDAPQPQEVETDKNPMLGMVTRQVASKWHEREKYSPFWIPEVDGSGAHNEIINRQVSSSGTAAAREAAGQFGHGTIPYAEGIEPQGDLQEGGKLGNEYFMTHRRPVQEGAVDSMTLPPGSDGDTTNRVAAAGKTNAREASMAAYRSMWEQINR